MHLTVIDRQNLKVRHRQKYFTGDIDYRHEKTVLAKIFPTRTCQNNTG